MLLTKTQSNIKPQNDYYPQRLKNHGLMSLSKQRAQLPLN